MYNGIVLRKGVGIMNEVFGIGISILIRISSIILVELIGDKELERKIAGEFMKKGLDFSDEEVRKIIVTCKKFDFKKELRIFGFSLKEEKLVCNFLGSFLVENNVEQFIVDYGIKSKFIDALVNLFDQKIRENTLIFELFGNKYYKLPSIFERWVNFVWDSADKNEIILNAVNAGRQEQKNDHKQQDEDHAILRAKLDYLQNSFDNYTENKSISSTQSNVKNLKTEYKNRWNRNVFLNNYFDLDEKQWKNIQLNEIYLSSSINYMKDINTLILEWLTLKRRQRLLLILGKPGVGKSTFITWLLNLSEDDKDYTCREIARIIQQREIMVYRFSDINIDWKDSVENCVDFIFQKLLKGTLNNKILILDGFDEVDAGNNRKELLHLLDQRISEEKDANSFAMFVTCRENYITDQEGLHCSNVVIQPYEKKQIIEFCEKYYNLLIAKANEEKQQYIEYKKKQINYFNRQDDDNEKDFFGIPLVLYMILASEIELNEADSKASVYDRLFALKDGLYDRAFECCYIENTRKKYLIEKWDTPHLITSQIKSGLDLASKRIAFHMFETNPNKAEMSYDDFETICRNVEDEDIELKKRNVNIIQFFDMVKHTEGGKFIQFVHRSIYEYFASKYIFDMLKMQIENLNDELSKKRFKKEYYRIFQNGKITKEIADFLKYKLLNLYEETNESDRSELYEWLEDRFLEMVENGFGHYGDMQENVFGESIRKESNCFSNFIIVLQNLSELNKKRFIMEDKLGIYMGRHIRLTSIADIQDFSSYLRGFDLSSLDLNNIELSAADLCDVNLSFANLSYSDMRNADLQSANLQSANLVDVNLQMSKLKNANMRYSNLQFSNLRDTDLCFADMSNSNLNDVDFCSSDLRFANLCSSNLVNANLRSANLSDANLSDANLSDANLHSAILISANLSKTNLSYAIIVSADLSDAKLKHANLHSSNLSYANLISTDLRYTNLGSANLTYSNLTSANLISANLGSANLISANLRSVKFIDANLRLANLTSANLTSTDFRGADLCGTKGVNIYAANIKLQGAKMYAEDYCESDRNYLIMKGVFLEKKSEKRGGL